MIQLIRGFKDILPGEVELWQAVEKVARQLLEDFGFKEIRIPIMERTELFARSIGADTDIVEKEMYTFADRKGDLITLRPEATASIPCVLKQRLRLCGPTFSIDCIPRIRSKNITPSVPCFVGSGPRKEGTGSFIRSMPRSLVCNPDWLMCSLFFYW
jgi:hypothetical protein